MSSSTLPAHTVRIEHEKNVEQIEKQQDLDDCLEYSPMNNVDHAIIFPSRAEQEKGLFNSSSKNQLLDMPVELWTQHIFKYLTLHDICNVLPKVSLRLKTYLEIYDPTQVFSRKMCFYYLKRNLECAINNLNKHNENHPPLPNLRYRRFGRGGFTRKKCEIYENTKPELLTQYSLKSTSQLRYYLKKEVQRIKRYFPDLLNPQRRESIIKCFSQSVELTNNCKSSYVINYRKLIKKNLQEEKVEYDINDVEDDFEYKNRSVYTDKTVFEDDYNTNLHPIDFNTYEKCVDEHDSNKVKKTSLNMNWFSKKEKPNTNINWVSVYKGLMIERENIISQTRMEKFVRFFTLPTDYDKYKNNLGETVSLFKQLIPWLKQLGQFKRYDVMYYRSYNKQRTNGPPLFEFVANIISDHAKTMAFTEDGEQLNILNKTLSYFAQQFEYLENFYLNDTSNLVTHLIILLDNPQFSPAFKNAPKLYASIASFKSGRTILNTIAKSKKQKQKKKK